MTHLGVFPVILLRLALYITYPLVAEKRVHTTSIRTYTAPKDMKAGINHSPRRVTVWGGRTENVIS